MAAFTDHGLGQPILAVFFEHTKALPGAFRRPRKIGRMTKMVRTIAALFLGFLLSATLALPAMAATKVTVNGIAITDIQISQRTGLFKLEGKKGSKGAMEELITEALQLQEAKRLGIEITDAQVQDSVLQVARNIKVSSDKLMQILQQNAVNIDTLKARLRAALAWNAITTVAVAPRVQISDADLEAKAEAKLGNDSSYDYILKEVLFVMAGKGNASARTADANRYRKSFQGCDSAVQLSLSYTDAAVREVGRRHATQLPDALAGELAKLNVGGISKPRVVEGGVSMLAICAKNSARDLTFIKSNLRAETGNEAMKVEAEKYLAELRAKARIVYN